MNNLQTLNLTQLKKYCNENGIDKISNKKKSDILELIYKTFEEDKKILNVYYEKTRSNGDKTSKKLDTTSQNIQPPNPISTPHSTHILEQNLVKNYSKHSIKKILKNGDLKRLQYFLKTTPYIKLYFDLAAFNGHIHLLEYLYDNKKYGTTRAMDWASQNGHLHVVEWLHNKGNGCSKKAIDLASFYGHLHVVEFLLFNRNEGYSEEAMINACRNGHLEIVKILENRGEKITRECISLVCKFKRYNIEEYLCKNNRPENSLIKLN